MDLTSKQRKEEPEISSASMADIAFLLIIFFMVTTVFSVTRGLDFKFPKEEKDAPPEREEAIYFKILEDGSFLMDGRPAEPDDIIDYIVPKLTRWPDKPIIIYTRPQAPYRAMVRVYDVLRKAAESPDNGGLGLLPKPPNVSIPTYREIQDYVQIFGYNPFDQ